MKPNFSKHPDGLIPVIVQDALSSKMLMLGYMNEEALEITKQSERVTFFSRSKQRLWTKGEISGNFLFVKEMLTDCDNDSILIKANPAGPVCHSGSDTCFGEENKFSLAKLEEIIADRRNNPSASYTSSLFQKGNNTIAQKLGEEAIELIIESKDNDDEKFLNEAADLLFHFLVLLRQKGFEMNNVVEILERRHRSIKYLLR